MKLEEQVTFYSEGMRVFGDLYLPDNMLREFASSTLGPCATDMLKPPCVIGLPGIDSNKDSSKWLTIAKSLYEKDYAFFKFNFRGCGEGKEKSEGKFEDTNLTGRIKDYGAALQYLEGTGKVDMNRLGVVASSFGGMVAIAAQDKRIKAMVTIGMPYKLPELKADGNYYVLLSGKRVKKSFSQDVEKYDLLEAVGNAPPIALIHGTSDTLVPLVYAIDLFMKVDDKQVPRILFPIEGADHSLSKDEHLNKTIVLSLGWFEKYL